MKLAIEDLKAIGASFSQLITATMISRLVLNLRSASVLPSNGEYTGTLSMNFIARAVGDLGELIFVLDDETTRSDTDGAMLDHRSGQGSSVILDAVV